MFKDACAELAVVPKPEIKLEESAVLFAGMSPVRVPGVFTTEVLCDVSESRRVDLLALKKIGGGTWFDYCREYQATLDSWLRGVGFYRAQSRAVVVDSTNPLSVLVLLSLRTPERTVAFTIVADKDSTAVEQNTSYTFLELARRKGIPLVLASVSQVKELEFLVESEGLLVGFKAFERLVAYFVGALPVLSDFMRSDLRLGVTVHTFSAVMAASGLVFTSPSEIFRLQIEQLSGEARPDELVTAYLLASGSNSMREELVMAFDRFTRGLVNLITKDNALETRADEVDLYDVIILFGLKDARIQLSLARGYERIAKETKNLRVEELEKIV